MNNERKKGFLAGVLASALVLGLGGAALAAGRTISVDDGIAVTINGVPFTPKDVNGKEVPLFLYEGTTYAPVRAFAEAAGLSVDYDAEAYTARIETPDYTLQSDPASGSYITADKARELALADAGVTAADALFLKAALDWEDYYEDGKKVNKVIYEVEFCAGTPEYDYELDALTCPTLTGPATTATTSAITARRTTTTMTTTPPPPPTSSPPTGPRRSPWAGSPAPRWSSASWTTRTTRAAGSTSWSWY